VVFCFLFSVFGKGKGKSKNKTKNKDNKGGPMGRPYFLVAQASRLCGAG